MVHGIFCVFYFLFVREIRKGRKSISYFEKLTKFLLPCSANEVLQCRLISKTRGFIAFRNQRKNVVIFLFTPCIDLKQSCLKLCIGSLGLVQSNTVMGPQKMK